MNVICCVLLICAAQVRAEFFHVPSRIQLSASGARNSDFGFSMGFQDAPPRLVVGAPQKNYVGQIYNCPLQTDLSKDVDCTMFDMSYLNIEKETNDARMERNPDQKFYLGSTIAATSDYFLTCAPLLTKYIKYEIKRQVTTTKVAGACYLHDNSSRFSEWKDSVYKLQNEKKLTGQQLNKRLVMLKGDGFGWNTLVENNGFLLVAKPTYPVDILSVPASDPSAQFVSLLEHDYEIHLQMSNTGYGMAVGSFFDKNITLYAISTQHMNLKGSVFFLEKTNNMLTILKNIKNDWISLVNNDQGTMFGYALAAADINDDGISELIVGAPAQPDENNKQEFGAIHIYIGGDMETCNDGNRMRTIIGAQENSRFGSAIATTDIDGDNLAEIIVGAPFENNGNGAVYVLSGFELNRLLSPEGRRTIRLTDLRLTQQLHADARSMRFGFSVNVVRDLDHNGCDELAIGSPAGSRVQLLRCLPAVTAKTTLKIIGDEIVKEDAQSFKVKVCLSVIIHKNCKSLTGSILVTSEMTGDVYIPKPTFDYDLTNNVNKDTETCEEVTVNLRKSGSSDYTFSTRIKVADVDNNGNRAEKAYKSWAVLSPYSELENSLPVKRYCTGTECEPKLNLTMTWAGDDTIDTSSTASKNQIFIIKVKNVGPDVKTASVRVFLKGARISQLTEQCYEENGVGEYSCALIKPLKRDTTDTIKVFVNTTETTNVPNMEFTAQLADEVFKKIKYEPKTLKVPFILDTGSVLVNGSNHNLQITDKDMEDSQIMYFSDNHEYYISNNGAVLWQDITAVLSIKEETFIQNVQTLTTESCAKQPPSNSQNQSIFICALTLRPGETKKITASFRISKKNIATDISKIVLKTSSTLSVLLHPTADEKQATLSTQMDYIEILEVGNNMTLIILIVVVVALALLLLISFILYKCGFFKRAEKQKLDVLRKSVRQRSIRKESEARSHKPSTADENNCEIIEVLDDCVFQEIDIRTQTEVTTSKDNVELINDSPELKHSS